VRARSSFGAYEYFLSRAPQATIGISSLLFSLLRCRSNTRIENLFFRGRHRDSLQHKPVRVHCTVQLLCCHTVYIFLISFAPLCITVPVNCCLVVQVSARWPSSRYWMQVHFSFAFARFLSKPLWSSGLFSLRIYLLVLFWRLCMHAGLPLKRLTVKFPDMSCIPSLSSECC
jgi:hypothetical protein